MSTPQAAQSLLAPQSLSVAQSHRPSVRGHRGSGVGRPKSYDRDWDLPRLLPLWPGEIVDRTLAGRQRIIARLRQALRAERQRGVGGHWTYDVARHAQLLAAYRDECLAIGKARGAGRQRLLPRDVAAE